MRYRAECDLIDTDRRLYKKGEVVELDAAKPHSTHLIPLDPVDPGVAQPKKRTKKATKKADGK